MKADAAAANAGRLGVCVVPKMQKMQKKKMQQWAATGRKHKGRPEAPFEEQRLQSPTLVWRVGEP